MKKNRYNLILCSLMLITGCTQTNKTDTSLVPSADNFKQKLDGKQTDLFLLKNSNGMQAAVTNYGGRLVSLIVPGKENKMVPVVVGFDQLKGYVQSTEPYFGASIGRYGNRIAAGKFNLEGKTYQLSVNNGPNTLHGGTQGFQYKVWDAQQIGDSVLVLSYVSPDGDNGFPGKLTASVTYTLTSNNELKLDYKAVTDQPTVVNLTNHAFFNLNGEGSGDIKGHLLQINADKFTPVDSTLIPTGELIAVKDSPFDFTKPETIGKRIEATNLQLQFGKGYDHNFVLNNSGIDVKAAEIVGDQSGVVMQIYTTEPGLQFYSGNFMQSKNKLRKGMDDFRTAFCLETQHFPDSPNQPSFPSTVLKPGTTYESHSIYKFSVKP